LSETQNDKLFRRRGLRLSELPQLPWLEKLIRTVKTFEVLLFKIFDLTGVYRPQKSIVGIPSLATRNFTSLQAAVYNGTQEEVLGFRPRRLLYRILRGLPDLELFERVQFQLSLDKSSYRLVEASTRTRGFIQLQMPWPLGPHSPRSSSLKLSPKGVETLLGVVSLGDYEVASAPLFFLNNKIKKLIVSDIDDTIKASHVLQTTGFRQVLSSIIKGHYYGYEPIPGMSDLYQKLNEPDTLILYLTSTPFQLSPFLLKFLRENKFPEGPVFPRWLGYRRFTHKFRVLFKILSQVDGQKVYLVGDSGEQDLQIYRRIYETEKLGEAIEKILIRHVPGTPKPALKHSKEYLFSDISGLNEHFRDSFEMK